MSKADFEKLKLGQEKMYSNYIDMAKTRQEFQKILKVVKILLQKNCLKTWKKLWTSKALFQKT